MSGIPLGPRMKAYEAASEVVLTPRMPMIIRVDGRAFHTFTRGLDIWDADIELAMTYAAQALVDAIAGAKFAYVQSDEISVLVTDYDTFNTQPWFGKNLQKIVSVAASIATEAFKFTRDNKVATFDARAFVLPREEVANYFVWRQQDAVRNSINSLGQKYFSHAELQGKNTDEVQEMLFQKHRINWSQDIPTRNKRGWTVWRSDLVDWEIPIFSKARGYIECSLIPEEE